MESEREDGIKHDSQYLGCATLKMAVWVLEGRKAQELSFEPQRVDERTRASATRDTWGWASKNRPGLEVCI